MVKFDIMKIRNVFLVEGFWYKISVYSVYEPLINFCKESICISLLHRFKTYMWYHSSFLASEGRLCCC